MRFAGLGIWMTTVTRHGKWRKGAVVGLSLLVLAACNLDPELTADAPSSLNRSETLAKSPLPAPTVTLNLRGSLDEPAENPAPAETIAVPSLGLDDQVATDSIAKALDTRPQFDIRMGFAPGDGTTALSAALKEALNQTAPKGIPGRFIIRGRVEISSTETGDTDVALTWAVRRADGAAMGEVTQTTTTSPSKIASFWGDFAKSAAGPAAKGIAALIASPSWHEGNMS